MQMQKEINHVQKQNQNKQYLKFVTEMFNDKNVCNLLITQIQQILYAVHSIQYNYGKIFIKIMHKPPHSKLHISNHELSVFLIRITKQFPLQGVRLYLIDGCFQPKIYDSRDFVFQALGQKWTYTNKLKDLVDKFQSLQSKLVNRNQQYLSLQKTGQFILGDQYIYNELYEYHPSLTLFTQKSSDKQSILLGLTQTHFLTFKRIIKKTKSKQEQLQEKNQKSLKGKKFMLSRCFDLQCIQSLNYNKETKELLLTVYKYKNVKSFNEYQVMNRKILVEDYEGFLRCILKFITKFQQMRVYFKPSNYNLKIQSKQDSAIQKIFQLNKLQENLEQGSLQNEKRLQTINKLNKSYQKLIQFYSARANPYYLIFVNKLNYIYGKYYIKDKIALQVQK